MGTVWQRPPGFLFGVAIGVDAHPARWRQFFDACQQGARRRHHGVEVQVVIERYRIEDRVDIAALEQRRQCRGKAQALTGARQVQGFYAETVTGDEQALGVAFPDGEGEHAIELGQQRFAPGVVTLEQHFGVTTGIEGVAKGFQLFTQFRKVINRAVERQGQAQLGVDHRLGGAVRQVHDFQASMAQGNRPLGMEAPRVRAAWRQVMGDSLHRCQVGRLVIET